jgi:hypothetical protein
MKKKQINYLLLVPLNNFGFDIDIFVFKLFNSTPAIICVHIDVNTRLMILSKYWNRQHKSLYRFMKIFEAKSMINRVENGGLIKFTKR